MQIAAIQSNQTWQRDNDPIALSHIFSENCSVALWERAPLDDVQQYCMQSFERMGQGIRNVFSLSSLKDNLRKQLPEAQGRDAMIEDLYLLADMLTCLFDCDSVGLRLSPMEKAMCPRFHVDNIPVRLVTTYLGEGTQWIPNEWADATKLGRGAMGKNDNESGVFSHPDAIHQMHAYDVGLLKGSAWNEAGDNLAAIHRSCPVEAGTQRVLVTMDPM